MATPDLDTPDIPTASVIQQRVTGIFLMGMVSYANLYSFKVAAQKTYRLRKAFWGLAALASIAIEVYYFLIVGISDMALRGEPYARRQGVNSAILVFGFFASTLTLFVRFFRLRRFVCSSDGNKNAAVTFPEEDGKEKMGGVTSSVGYHLCSVGGVVIIPLALAHVVLGIMATDEGPALDLAMNVWRGRAIMESVLHLILDGAFFNKIRQLKSHWTTWAISWKTHFGLLFQAFWSLIVIAMAIAGFFIPNEDMVIDFYLIAIAPTVDLQVFLLVNDRIIGFINHGGNFKDGSVWESEKKSRTTAGGQTTGSQTNIATAFAHSQSGSQSQK